jgi:hypothetical protein
MVTNTLQTLIDYTKDLTGLTNVSNAKVIRALNFGVDSLSFLSLLASGRVKNDSRKHGDIPRVTTTVTAGTTKVLLEDELATLQGIDIYVNGEWVKMGTVDRRDISEPLDTHYGTGTPRDYDVEAGHAYLYPVPDASYELRLTYGRPHPRFEESDLTLSTGIMPLHEEYVALFAADRLMIGSNDPSRAQIRNELALIRKDVIDSFKIQDESGSKRIKPKVNGAFSSSFNRRY